MSNNKQDVMKSNLLILVFALFTSFAIAQNENNPNALTPNNLLAPEFTGVQKSQDILEYLNAHIDYPEIEEKGNIEGKVVIGFNVLPSGKLSDFEVIQSPSYGFDQAVIRTLRNTNGMWNAGTIDGVPVRMESKVTVQFRMDGNDSDKSSRLYAEKLK